MMNEEKKEHHALTDNDVRAMQAVVAGLTVIVSVLITCIFLALTR